MKRIHTATATANQSYRKEITDDVVVEAIKNMRMPEEWRFHHYDFFADNTPGILMRFCEEYGISSYDLSIFYEKFIKTFCRNRYLEEVWKY